MPLRRRRHAVTSTRNSSHPHDLLEAYALGALEAEELAAVESHLRRCADCRAEADELVRLAHVLPEALAAASPLEPPAELRRRVLEGFEPTHPPRAPRRRRLAPRALGAFAAAVLVALALGWGLGQQRATARERDLRARLSAFVGLQETVLEVVDSRNTVKAFLQGTSRFPRSYGKLYTRPDLRDVVVFGARLPTPPPDRTYHVWLTNRGRTRLVGALIVRDRFGLLVFRARRPGPVYDRAQIRLERRDARRPGGTLVLTSQA